MANYNTSSGNHTFNDEIRVDEIKDNAGTGAPNFPNGLQLSGVDISSGFYTPSISSISGFDAVTTNVFMYLQVGNVVHVAGTLSLDPTTLGSSSSFQIDLPVSRSAGSFGSTNEAAGVGVNQIPPTSTGRTDSVQVRAQPGGQTVAMTHGGPTHTGNSVYSFQFTYRRTNQ